jgi:hypothetical protein
MSQYQRNILCLHPQQIYHFNRRTNTRRENNVSDMTITYSCATKYIYHDADQTHTTTRLRTKHGEYIQQINRHGTSLITHLAKFTSKYPNNKIHVIIAKILLTAMCNICIYCNRNNRYQQARRKSSNGHNS